MKRRQWLLSLPAALAVAAASAQAQPSYSVSSAQLQQAVAGKFPMRYPVGGLLELTLQPPRLRLLPEQNRLGTSMVVDAAGPALSRSGTGNFDVDFALRYEPSDQSIRASPPALVSPETPPLITTTLAPPAFSARSSCAGKSEPVRTP